MTDTSSIPKRAIHKLPRIAGLIVSVASAGFVFGLLLYLFYSAELQNTHFAGYGTAASDFMCSDDACRRVALEADLQQMRSARVGYALIYRFSLAAAAIIVSLATIVLGAVLVFDRVQSAADNMLTIEADKYSATIVSTWPGLVMVTLGSITLCVSIVLSGPLAPKLHVIDLPVFVEDPNTLRTRLGIVASVDMAGANGSAGTEPKDYPSLLDNSTEEGEAQ